jgi:prepilin signal peptidase PulO-like enzyme (type II secretory pathway)
MIAIAVASAFFACIAIVGIQLSGMMCANVSPAEDGPAPAKPPYVLLAGAAAVLGGFLVAQKAEPLHIGIAAIVMFGLVACWCSDMLCGIVPDAFTLGPLGALFAFSLAVRDWGVVLSALIVFAPFAVAAVFSRGTGMGWGDAKLVALSGAALGAPLAAMALAAACLAAVIGHRFGRGAQRPIAFAPYIAALTGVVLPVGLVH